MSLELSQSQYEACWNSLNLDPDTRVAIGVSGGPDSMALAFLEKRRNKNCIAYICDHALRTESAAEASIVSARLSEMGITHRILKLDMTSGTAVQERARNARYSAMVEAMYQDGFDLGLGVLLVGHHQSDQAETVLHRQRSGSGPDGLSGMLLVRNMEQFKLARPLLHVDKQRLQMTLVKNDLKWVLDPSNNDEKYTRVKLRNELSNNEDNIKKLCDDAVIATMHRMSIEQAVSKTIKAMNIHFGPGRSLCFSLQDIDSELAPRVMRRLLQYVTTIDVAGSGRNIKLESAFRLFQNKSGTLEGGLLTGSAKNRVWLCREPAAVEKPLQVADWLVWDKRYRVPSNMDQSLTIGCIGDQTTEFRKKYNLGHIPHTVLQSVYCWRYEQDIVGVPDLGIGTLSSCLAMGQHLRSIY